MKKILLTLAFVLPFFGFGQALTNKTFDANTSGWTKGAGGASTLVAWDATEGAASPGSLKLTAAQANARVQLSADALPINGAGDYTLTYKVKGPVGKKVRGDVFNNGAAIIGTVATLTGGWDTVTKTFTLNSTPTNIRLLAIDPDLASPYSTYYFDDVEWTFVPPAGNTVLTATASVLGQGTVSVSPNQSSYLPTDVVTLTATPSTHFVFKNWSGNLTGSTNPATLTMDTNKSVTANFSVDTNFNYVFNFNTDGDQEGWASTDMPDLTTSQSGGLVTLTPTANKFARYSLVNFPINTANYNKITVKLQNNSATTDQLVLVANNGTTTTNTVNFIDKSTVTPGFKTYEFFLNSVTNAAWNGTVNDFKLRFADSLNTANPGKPSDASTIIIDEIAFSYDPALSTSDVSKAKNLLQVYVSENTLNFRNANVSKATIFNMNGQLVKDAKVQNNAVDVSNLKAGVYMVKTVAQDNTETVTKFIKK